MAKRRRTRAQWQQLIEGQPASGLSIADYCAQHQLAVSNFYLWRKKLVVVDSDEASVTNWLSLTPSQPEGGRDWQIELSLPGGVVLRMNALG